MWLRSVTHCPVFNYLESKNNKNIGQYVNANGRCEFPLASRLCLRGGLGSGLE